MVFRNGILSEEDCICFTTDLDWAPEPAIKMTLEFFEKYDIRPTVFVTHNSKVVSDYAGKLDLGIHPNFVQPSSHGRSLTEIIEKCKSIVPATKCFRCHRWYAVNDIYDELWSRGFRFESNLCTDMDLVAPFRHRSGMICFPVFFEDGALVQFHNATAYSDVRYRFINKGLKVINIHPMHYALNTPYFQYTRDIKDRLSQDEWNNMDSDFLENLIFDGKGIRNFIIDLTEDAVKREAKIITLNEAYKCVVDAGMEMEDINE